MKPVVVDAMGGDNAPSIVIEGVREAIDAGIPVELVGDPHMQMTVVTLFCMPLPRLLGWQKSRDVLSAIRKTHR